MAIFGVKTNDEEIVRKFLKDTKKRFAGGDLVKNPFTASLKFFKKQSDLIIIIDMVPLWPNFPPYIAGLSLFSLLLFGRGLKAEFLFIPLFFLFLSIFWTSDFFFYMFKKGLRKAGYKFIIKRMKQKALIVELTRRV